MRSWIKYLVLSVVIHIIIIAGIHMFGATPHAVSKNKEQSEVVQSYLVVTQPVVQAEQTEPDPPIEDLPEPPEPQPQQALDSSIEVQTDKLATGSGDIVEVSKETKTDVPSVSEPKTVQTETETTESEASLSTNSTSSVTTQQFSAAVRDYLKAETKPETSWQQHRRDKFINQYQQSTAKDTSDLTGQTPFAAKGTGIDLVAVSADGSKLVKHQGTCFSVARDQWGDDLWTPTACPGSANKNSEILKQSLTKYGLLKDQQ